MTELASIDQGTDDWHTARLGKVTASRLGDLMAKTKSGYSTSRRNYLMELLCQRLTGEREETYTSSEMQWGIDNEPLARTCYEVDKDILVEEVGLFDHPEIDGFAASPDGLVGEDGLIEIKCPKTKTHIDFIQTLKIDPKYQKQMTAQMLCTGRNWCDFVSFDPRLPENLQFVCVRYNLDEELASEIVGEVTEFLSELDGLTEKMRNYS